MHHQEVRLITGCIEADVRCKASFNMAAKAVDFTCPRSTLKSLYCMMRFVQEMDNEEKTSLSHKASAHYIQIF